MQVPESPNETVDASAFDQLAIFAMIPRVGESHVHRGNWHP
jgi:hypothetical protein